MELGATVEAFSGLGFGLGYLCFLAFLYFVFHEGSRFDGAKVGNIVKMSQINLLNS